MKFKDAKYFGVKLSEHRIKNDKGQLIVTGCTFARTGKQKYHSSELGLNDDKFIYLDRPYEEVKNPKTVASFEGAPVTEDHPEDDVKVGVNWDRLAKGMATNVKFVDDVPNKEGHLEADFIITDKDLIEKIESGKVKELSAGYNCDVDEDTWKQSKIRGNHIAVVSQARAGHSACLRDSAYKSTSKKPKTLKIGDKLVKIVDSYSYEIEDETGEKATFTDYYTEGVSGKKKFLCTIKDESNPKNVILCKVDNKWTKWGGTNRNKLEEDSRYDALVKQYGKENIKLVKNENLDEELKKLKDSKESDARVLKALEKLLPEFKKLDEKYAYLVAMQKKYWNSWDGYRKAVRSGELSEAKLDKMQAQSVKANKEYSELVKKWNKLCEQTTRRVSPINYARGVATDIKGNEELHFPEDHYYGNTSVERFSYMLNEINKVLAEYPNGTGGKDWTKAKDAVNPIFEKRAQIDTHIRDFFNGKPEFEIEGFDNGIDSTEGSIYVVNYLRKKDRNSNKPKRNEFDDFEDYLEGLAEYVEDRYVSALMNIDGVEDIDVGVCEYDPYEDINIDIIIYCKGVEE